MNQPQPLLEVKNLVTSFHTEEGVARAVDNVGFRVFAGKTLGVVGESGCGKSVTALSILRLLPKPSGRIEKGEIIYQGKDILKLPVKELYDMRGKEISMIFQEPMTALNPVQKIYKQVDEVIALHFPLRNRDERYRDILSMFKRVGIADPESKLNSYPHELSGGMRQRVMIAMALSCRPKILIADEPTTALDVTIQAQILSLIKELQDEFGMAVIFITHDLGVIAEMCDDVLVMYGGTVVEYASVKDFFRHPLHPYSQGLLSAIPKIDLIPKTLLDTIPGVVPSIYELRTTSCRFANRCSHSQNLCSEKVPPLEVLDSQRQVRCFFWQQASLEFSKEK